MRIQNSVPANLRMLNRAAGSPTPPNPTPDDGKGGSTLDRWSRGATMALVYSSVPLGGAILGGFAGAAADALLKTGDYTCTNVGLVAGFAIGMAELYHQLSQPVR